MAGLAKIVIERLQAYPHFVVLKKHAAIGGRSLIEKLGVAIASTPPLNARARKPSFRRIEIDPNKSTEVRLATRYSRTNEAMALHTDDSFHVEPYELVIFDFVRTDPHGGDTLLAAVEDVIGALDDKTKDVLEQPKFPFGNGVHPILWQQNGTQNIRYSKAQLDKIRRADDSLTERELGAMAALDAVLCSESISFRFHAEPGETLFLHNTKVLHGRTGFSAESLRLMYRTRMHAGCLS